MAKKSSSDYISTRKKRKSSSKKRKKRTASSGKTIAWTIGIILTVGTLGLASFLLGVIGYHGEDKWVKIPYDATKDKVHQILRDSLGTSEGNRVYLLWRVLGSDEKTANGAYLIPHGQAAIVTAKALRSGSQTPVDITLHGTRTMQSMAERLTSTLECSAEDFLAACDSILPSEGYTKEQFPAAFIPDKYQVYWNTSPSALVRRLVGYRNRFWTEERIKRAQSLGLSPVDVATLGSIVEEESAKKDERPRIARLYINRLDKNMLLQADPTVKFSTGDFKLRRITGEHLRTESPYNTYLHKGLPPGPIRIVEKSTLEGVLDAPEHNYIYMCAKEDFSGYHNFATDYAAHMINARRYQAELNRRNIR